MRKTSRSSPYWQTVCKCTLLPWLANLGNPVMIPHIQGRKTGSHDKTVERGRERGGERAHAQRNAKYTQEMAH